MNLDEKKKIIEESTNGLLEKMGFKATVYTATTVSPPDNQTSEEEDVPISVEIQLSESKYLIGKHGANLAALQHILRVMMRKKTGERINFNVDINGYREDQRQTIVDTASEVAAKVSQEKKAVMLRPMNAYERRLVHVELANREGIKTESVGEGEDRKVVIKPASVSDELEL